MLTIAPKPERILLKLQLLSSLAHSEAGPANVGANNLQLFNRDAALLHRPPHPPIDATEALDVLWETSLIGASAYPFLQAITGPQVIATLFTTLFPICYGRGDGEGLFSGVERYRYLATRLSDAASSCTTLAEAWSFVCRKLQLPHPPEVIYKRLASFWLLPPHVQELALQAVRRTPDLCIMGARFVAESLKATSQVYAIKAGIDAIHTLHYVPTESQQASLAVATSDYAFALLPAVSGNALRHVLLREPGATRLLLELGLNPADNPVPVGVERLLYGGGNTAAKVTAPSNADLLEAGMRERYPFIDALGGAVDRFLLSRSAVSIAGWVVCRENNTATEAIAGIVSDLSLYDLIDEVTRTRTGIRGHDKDSGQMIFSYEVLPPGTELLIEITFQPFTRLITKGCIHQAVLDWQASGAMLGAKTAQGHGRCAVTRFASPYAEGATLYLDYLAQERDRLAAGLRTGHFCTELVLCAQT